MPATADAPDTPGLPEASEPARAVRPAHLEDAAAILEIYAPYVRDTDISFEYEVPGLDEFRSRLAGIINALPYLVCERDGRVFGYAYASRYQARAAYQWDVETSIYLDQASRSRGLGRALYTELFRQLEALGYYNAYACLAHPNPASQAFHEKFGFRPVGVMHGAGFKLGRWRDVLWMEKRIRPLPDSPLPPQKPDRQA